MQDKYLPIGSIVTIKSNSKKIMIIGYYSVEYEDNITIYDYVGCSYPEGILNKKNVISFNHEDILNIDFIGFTSDEYKAFNKYLNNDDAADDSEDNNIEVNNTSEEKIIDIFADVEPVVGKNNTEDIVPIEVDELESLEEDVISDGNEINDLSSEEPIANEYTIPHYHFDENGIIISE